MKYQSILPLLTLLSLTSAFAPNANNNMKSSSFSSTTSATSLNAEYKKVFVAGGSKGVGRSIINQLIEDGSEVVALVRSDEAVSELNSMEGVTTVQGDAFDYKVVEGAIDGCDAAITTLGGRPGDEKYVDYEGNNHVIEAAGILGVTRVVLVTSIGCGTSKEAVPPGTMDVLKDVLAAKERAEKVLIKYYTNMNWTIVRPGGLKSEPATGNAILTEDATALGSIHRDDVASLVLKALKSESTERKVFSAIDPSVSAATNVEGATYEEFALN